MKKLIAMLLLAGFLCVNVVGCGGGTTKSSGPGGAGGSTEKSKDTKSK